jgi:methionyl-tRNA formyltransferase
VFTDSSSKEVIELCKKETIPFYAFNPRKGKGIEFLKENEVKKPHIIFSINYIFLIEEDIIEFSEIVSLNIHGSLLPKYRGRTPLIWAIINGEKETGITIHEIDTGCDTGKILIQKKIPIPPTSTGADMVAEYSTHYDKIIFDAIDLIETGNYHLTPQNEADATYFGVRRPKDGIIDWNWPPERLLNWVRALSPPYPGAFSYLNGEKVVIERASKSSYPFSDHQKNGTVIGFLGNKPIIKCLGGCVIIEQYSSKLPLEEGNELRAEI